MRLLFVVLSILLAVALVEGIRLVAFRYYKPWRHRLEHQHPYLNADQSIDYAAVYALAAIVLGAALVEVTKHG